MSSEITPLEMQLKGIQETGEFFRLEPFKDSKSWKNFNEKERNLLATLFVVQGELLLKEGKTIAFEKFTLAQEISSDDPDLCFNIAMSLSKYPENPRCLQACNILLHKVLKLKPTSYEALIELGVVLTHQAKRLTDVSYLDVALEKFIVAENYIPEEKRAFLHWQRGNCWAVHGHLSGEASDFNNALIFMRQAYEQGMRNSEFLNQYALVLMELSSLFNRKEALHEAAELLEKATQFTAGYFDGLLNLGCCYQRLYEFLGREEDFDRAEETFERASAINTECLDVWIHWGKLYVYTGKLNGDAEAFERACVKFVQANRCEPSHPYVLSLWAEAEMFQGTETENLELLRSAEARIIKSLELSSDQVESWRIYGACLSELGRYFGDEIFYRQALEKYQYALTLNSRHPFLWYGKALAYFAIGDLHNDEEMLEKACHACSKVMEYGGQTVSQFWADWGIALVKLAEISADQAYLESAIEKFEKALESKDLDYILNDDSDSGLLYHYGCAHDFLGDFTGNVQDYERAVLILTHVVKQDPQHPHAQYNLAVALIHLGEANNDVDCFVRAIEHFPALLQEDIEDEVAWNEWGLALLNLAHLTSEDFPPEKSAKYFDQSEEKLIHAIALGSTSAYYNLACLYSLRKNYAASMHFIEKAASANALPSMDDILHDEWLDGLRETPDFRYFISVQSQKNDQDI